MTCGIYCIENKITNALYAGKSVNLERRMWQYHDECWVLLNALEKYGEDNFDRYIIEECSEDALNDREIYWIKELHSHVSEGGYNISWGGDGPNRNREFSNETREKMSVAAKNKFLNGFIHPFLGKHHNDETKKIISIANKGKEISKESRESISKTLMGHNVPNEVRKKISDSHIGMKSDNSSSKYYGVSIYNITRKDKKYSYWHVNICVNGKQKHIYSSKNEIEAARAYDKYVIENNLPNPLNFPEDYERREVD